MFKNVYYNNRSNKIYLWETINGKEVKTVEDYEDIYYIADPNGEHKDIFGNKMTKKIASHRDEIKNYKDLHATLAESDIDKETKYLQHRYGKLDLKSNIKDFNICYIDIEIAAEAEFPKPEEAKYPINLITVKSSTTQEVVTFGLGEYTGNSPMVGEYHYVVDEADMLVKFSKWFRKQKFDIITGWNVQNFDMTYIFNRLENLMPGMNLPNAFSPANKTYKKRNGLWDIKGLSVLDYLELYKNFMFVTEESYTLQAIGMKVVKEGKIDLDGSVNTIYKTDWNTFVEYNIQDVLLVEKIEAKKRFLELSVTFCYNSLIPLEHVTGSITTIEGYMMKYLHREDMVMPDRKHGIKDWWVEHEMYVTKENGKRHIQNEPPDGTSDIENFYCKGGYVEAKPGFYKHLMSFDITSLYPHMIIQYNISPETKVTNPTAEQIASGNLIKSEINGVYYDKTKKGVLVKIIEDIFNERKMFKQKMFEYKPGSPEYQYYDSQQHVRKILINSMYGVLINKWFHFFDIDNARAITRGGRVLIKYLSVTANDYFQKQSHVFGPKLFPGTRPKKLKNHITALIDTDSTYICLDEFKENYAPDMDYMEFCDKTEPFIEDFYEKILKVKADAKSMPQCIDFKREGRIIKQFVLAKKKYLTELLQNEDDVYDPPKLKATGVEIKRSDTPAFCRNWIEMAVRDIFEFNDKEKNIKLIKKIFKDFKKQPIDNIASIGSVKEYDKYAKGHNITNFKGGTPMRNKAAICYNHVIKSQKLPYMAIDNGTKIKYIRVNPRNIVKNDAIAWVGKHPPEFDKIFDIDYDEQFTKTFMGVLTRMHIVLDWCTRKHGIQLKTNKLGGFIS